MPRQQPTWRLGLYVGADPFKRGDTLSDGRPNWTVEIYPVIVGSHPSSYEKPGDPDRVTNPTDRADFGGLRLDHFIIHTYIETQADGTRRPWGWTRGFRSIFSIDQVSEADRIAKTLRTIDRRMARLSDREGYPADFPDYVRHVAEAIRADVIVFAKGKGGWSYSETAHRICPIGDGINQLRSKFTQFLEPQPAQSGAQA